VIGLMSKILDTHPTEIRWRLIRLDRIWDPIIEAQARAHGPIVSGLIEAAAQAEQEIPDEELEATIQIRNHGPRP
jgi:hypothetical protein